jgi:hypothetical protein
LEKLARLLLLSTAATEITELKPAGREVPDVPALPAAANIRKSPEL